METKERYLTSDAPPLIKVGGRSGAEVVLYDLNGTSFPLCFRLKFSYSNNVAEGEALVIGSSLPCIC